jgi:hypothetical protein
MLIQDQPNGKKKIKRLLPLAVYNLFRFSPTLNSLKPSIILIVIRVEEEAVAVEVDCDVFFEKLKP